MAARSGYGGNNSIGGGQGVALHGPGWRELAGTFSWPDGGSVADGRHQAGSGMARNRARARMNWFSRASAEAARRVPAQPPRRTQTDGSQPSPPQRCPNESSRRFRSIPPRPTQPENSLFGTRIHLFVRIWMYQFANSSACSIVGNTAYAKFLLGFVLVSLTHSENVVPSPTLS